MAIVICKGTKLQEEIASVYTDVAQIISMDLPEGESETFEADTLDNANAGIPYRATGRTEGGSMSLEMFFDPALTGHRRFTAKLSSPSTTLPQNYKVIFANATNTEWPMSIAGVSMGASVALNDGLKSSVTMKLNGIPTYPA